MKSSRKLKPMKVKGRVYDPMPHAPTSPTHSCVCTHTRATRAYGHIDLTRTRKVRVFKSGKRRITF
jgi:hypothetical protein